MEKQVSSILKNAFERLQKSKNVTAKVLAEELNISEAFLSQILNNKKNIPLKTRFDFYRVFELDRDSVLYLESFLSSELLKKYGFTQNDEAEKVKIQEFKEYTEKEYEVLDKWYYITILDLLTCDDIKSDVLTIAERTGLSKQETFDALIKLFKMGLAHEDKETGQWKKADNKARFPTSKSHPEIRNYHKQILRKAMSELEIDKSYRFDKRYIATFSVAVNPRNVEKARDHLAKSMYEAVEILGEGKCSEVYNINYQLLPMTLSSLT